jgi:hypothetical protein
MHIIGSDLIGFDFRLVALSGLALFVATYATVALAERIKASRGRAWFAWLGGGASAMGIGIWSMHYLGLKALDLPVPMLNNPAVPLSILATIFASGITLLVVSEKRDSGRHGKATGQRVSFDLAFLQTYLDMDRSPFGIEEGFRSPGRTSIGGRRADQIPHTFRHLILCLVRLRIGPCFLIPHVFSYTRGRGI